MADATETITCSQCGANSPAGQRFCGSCGAPLAIPASREAGTVEAVTTALHTMVAPQENTVSRVPSRFSAGVGVRVATVMSEKERERDRLLTLANVQRMRGQLAEARSTVTTALTLSEGMSDTDLAPVHELIGDLLQAEGNWEEARVAFEKAHMLDPSRVGAEKKFAETTLRIAEAKAIASGSMLGLGGDSFGSGAFGGGNRGKRNPGLALILSLFVPGFGQLFNGELVKAGICLGVYLLTLVALFLSPDCGVLLAKIRILLVPTDINAGARAQEPLSPVLICLLILLGLNWLYSLFDAAAGASKSVDNSTDITPPAGDRSGWEV